MIRWFGKKSAAAGPRVAVTLRGEVLRYAAAQAGEGRPVLRFAGSQPLAAREPPALGRAVASAGFARASCATLLAPGEYQLLQVDAPTVDDTELREVVRWKVKDMVDFPVDQATVEVLDIPASGSSARGRQLFVAIAPNSALQTTIQLFQDARLDLQVIDLPELAQRNVAACLEQENRAVALLNFDDVQGLMTFTFGGALLGMRRIEITLRQLEEADAGRREQLFDRIALEVQRSVDNFERLTGGLTLSALRIIDVLSVPGLLDYLQGYLSIPVVSFDLQDIIDLTAVPELADRRRQCEYLEVIGAALREEVL